MTIAERVARDGWCALDATALGGVDAALLARVADEAGELGARRGGLRNLLARVPSASALVADPAVVALADAVLGADWCVARAILFDKTPRSNWKVPWHQDRAIAVRERVEVDGFGPWSVKEGVPHVQPPPRVLERMLTVRVHLDACGPANGPLRVLPGTHRDGVLDAEGIAAARARVEVVDCVAPRGGIVAFRPLLLHASSSSVAPGHRRVAHVELAPAGLLAGTGLAWVPPEPMMPA